MRRTPLNPLASLRKVKANALAGVPVGGLWRLRDNHLEIQRFGGTWSRVPPEQVKVGPNRILLWNGTLALAPG